ncbi:hypothetical protein [Bacillus tuaregi]|uniref:hypothetical protein n=1 Tax=Bacillus tuaregi TaxID=1816695 RepID=UPI0008F86664|nr:hypothetical protein [Bacillus tuaregi]
MQVNNQTIRQHKTLSEAPLELKQGEVIRATIKETLSDTDAILHIKGKEVRTRFSEGVPSSGQAVTIQIKGQADGMLQAKTIVADNAKSPSAEEKILATAGLTGKEAAGVKQAVRILLDKGLAVSKETVQELEGFIEKAKGTLEQKMDTVRALANKRLEATGTQLRAVHEALKGKPLNEVLTDLAKEIDPEFKLEPRTTTTVKQTDTNANNKAQNEATPKTSTQSPPSKTDNITATLKPDNKNNIAINEQPAQSPDEAVASSNRKQSESAKQAAELSQTIRKNLELVNKEHDLKKAIAKIREEIVQNPKLDRELAQKIDKAAQEALKLQSIGKERLVEALKSAEAQVVKNQQATSQMNTASHKPIEANSQEVQLSSFVKKISQEVSNSPNLKQSIERVKEQLVHDQRLPLEMKEKVNHALTGASSLEKQGRITTGKELLKAVLNEVEASVVQAEKKAAQQVQTASQPTQTPSIPEQRTSEIIKAVKAELQAEPNLQRAVEKVQDKVILNPKIDREVARKVEQAVKEATQLQQAGRESAGRERLQQALSRAEVELQQIEAKQPKQQTQAAIETETRPSETVKEVKAEVQKERNLHRAVEKIQEKIISNPKVDREVAQKVEQAVKEAVQLQQIGRESAGRERLQQALAKAEVELKEIEASQPKQSAQTKVETEPRASETVKQVRVEIQTEPNLHRAVEKIQEKISSNPKVNHEVAKKVEQAVKEAVQIQQIGRESAGRERLQQALARAEVELQEIETNQPKLPAQTKVETEPRASEIVKQVKAETQTEPNLQRAVEKVQEKVISNPKVDREVAQKVEQAVKEAVQLQRIGRESAGRERLQQALARAEVELQQMEAKQPKQQTQAAIETETRPSETVKEVKAEVQKERNLQRAVEKVQEKIISNPKVDREVAQKVEQAVKEAVQLQQIGRESAGRERLQQALAKAEVELQEIEASQPKQPVQTKVETEPRPSETVKEVKAEVQTEPNLQRAVEKVQEKVISNPKVDREVAQKVEQAVKEAVQLQQYGRESAGRERLQQALAKAEVELKEIEASQPKQPAQTKIETEPRASETVKQVRAETQKEPNLQRAVEKVQEKIISNPKIDREVAQKVEKAVKEAVQLQQIGRGLAGRERLQQALAKAEVELQEIEASQPKQSAQTKVETETRPSETVKQVKAETQTEPNLQRVVEKIQEKIISNPKVNREVAQKVEQAVKETVQLQQMGRNAAGRERLQQALAKAEVELQEIEVSQPKQPAQTKIETEPRPSETVKQVKAETQTEPNLHRAVEKVQEKIISNPNIDREVAQKVEKAVKEAVQLQQYGRETTGREKLLQALAKAEVELQEIEVSQPKQPAQLKVEIEHRASETVKQVRAEIQAEPNLQRATEKVQEKVISNPKVNHEVAQKVEQAVKEAVQLQQIGRESASRERLQQALAQAGVELNDIEATQPKHQVQAKVDTEPRASGTVKQIKAEIQTEPNLQRAVEKVQEKIISNPKIDREVAQKVEQATKEAVQLQQIGRESAGRERLQQALAQAEVELNDIEATQPKHQVQAKVDTEPLPSETIKQVKAELQTEPNLLRAVDKVQEKIISNPKIDREVTQKVEQAVKEAVQLQQVGREKIGRERLQQALTKAEAELQQIEVKQPQQTTQTKVEIEPRPSETVKQVKAELQTEPNLQRAVEKVQEQIIDNPKINREVAQKLEQAVKLSQQLAQIGRETIGRGHLQNALTQAESELQKLEASKPVQANQDSQPEPTESQPAKQEQNTQTRESIKNVREQIQTEPNLKKAVQKVQELITQNKNIDPEISRNIERLAGQADQLDQAGRERLVKMLQQVESALQQTTEAKGQATNTNSTAQTGQQNQSTAAQQTSATPNNQEPQAPAVKTEPQVLPSQSIKQALTKLQKEPNLEKALEQVRQEISSNPSIEIKSIEKVEKALEHTQQLHDKGREIAARQHITKELSQVEQDVIQTEPKKAPETKPQQDAIPYDINEQLQGLNVQGKDILITKVTQKLAQATHDFRELKREISRNLDNVERVIQTFKKNAYPQAKQMLEATISKLDKAILKSEMMLFTDMRTEKQLLQASTQLAEAKKLLAKGDHAQAGKIVHDVKSLIDKIIFKPSEQKIVHFVDKEVLGLEKRSPAEQLLSKFSESTHGSEQNQEASARQMYDKVRSLGLNHESELAKSLVFHRNDPSGSEQQQQQNLKEALMKLAQGEGQDSNPKIAQQAEQALSNLTGQQLLSKSDGNGTLQSMFFNLPFLLGGKPENLQVFINSKNEGEQVEWENCNLYFLLETKKLGDVGILLNSTDRNLAITIKNDLPGFKERMAPIAEMTKEKLQEVGYNVSSIQFARMSPVAKQSSQKELEGEMEQVKVTRQIFNEKGLNITI